MSFRITLLAVHVRLSSTLAESCIDACQWLITHSRPCLYVVGLAHPLDTAVWRRFSHASLLCSARTRSERTRALVQPNKRMPQRRHTLQTNRPTLRLLLEIASLHISGHTRQLYDETIYFGRHLHLTPQARCFCQTKRQV